jgi:hypothetical protein
LLQHFFYGARLRAYANWLFGTNDTVTFGSLLFIEAALIIGVGAFIAAGYSENMEASPRGSPRTPYMWKNYPSNVQNSDKNKFPQVFY